VRSPPAREGPFSRSYPGVIARFLGHDSNVPETPKSALESAIRGVPAKDQRRLAILLADVVIPFGDLSDLTDPPLQTVAERLRGETEPFRVDLLRRHLWDAPALREHEEPSDPASWYALGAVVAWLYVADCLSTAPSDGAVNAYTRVTDLLDEAENDLQMHGLCDRLDAAVRAALTGDEVPLIDLRHEVDMIARRIGTER
jgi:hypothetical protein